MFFSNFVDFSRFLEKDKRRKMSNLSWFRNLPEALREQLMDVCDDFSKDERVRSELEKLRSKHGKQKKEVLLAVAVLTRIPPTELMNEKWLRKLCCYHYKRDKTLTLSKPFTSGKHVRLFHTKDHRGRALVAKWYRSGSRSADYEIQVYRKLKHLGCPLPYFSKSYRFWNDPVLVMEKLDELGPDEDYYQMGREVLDQLRYLHSFAIHNDIKIGNVMKKVSRGETTYYLIDYGGVAQERLEHGFRRWIWSKHWTSQKPHKSEQVTTAKHDLIELGYTMNGLRNLKKGRKDADARANFKGKIRRYMDRVRVVDPENIRSRDYEDLIEILS
ncbi:hypothetical protein pv_408 [Pithovirus sibericum]|uniref:Protein kinase domain-containing protein n=1 Tax=Pithovirus sibericum TaxID=1450746 RepID=W5S5M4_9VIRU|nr:hypothetical protein pv_408 [Pithovirus sibericum]AHH01974.1 hypothetical protein pv_408 [Pithovirus sibericum]